MSTLRILNVTGARPNFMKVAALVAEMQRQADFQPLLVHTGQHYDQTMSDQFFQDLGLPEPDAYLGVGSGSHAQQTARIMEAFEPCLTQMRPDLVVVVGDVNSTVACALVASKLHIPVAHVEAGLRSFDRTMPEEINRVVTDHVSDYLFVSEPSGVKNLRAEGIDPDRVFFVGNVMIDTVLRFRKAAAGGSALHRLSVSPGQYALVTLHRPSNVDRPEPLRGLVRVLARLSQHLPVLWPVHPRTRARLDAFGLMDCVCKHDDLHLLEPLGYLDFLQLMDNSRVVITDSGGIQEETTALGVPCVTVRENTERPVTVETGTNFLAGTQPARVWTVIEQILAGNPKNGKVPPLWDGRAAERIVQVLRDVLGAARTARAVG